MDLRDRFHHAAAWLEASPAEMAGLLSLLLGGVALTLYVVLVPRGLDVDVGAHDIGSASEPVVGVPSLSGEVTVHVVGAVAGPGLVVVPLGSRVADAIAGAGGATPDAELGALNLARPVSDGEKIVVPRVGEAAPVGPDGAVGGGAWRADGKLDLNAATAAEFEELPGVGPVLAGRIVDWREQHGPFVEIGQLREVAGIGEKTFQAMSELVTV